MGICWRLENSEFFDMKRLVANFFQVLYKHGYGWGNQDAAEYWIGQGYKEGYLDGRLKTLNDLKIIWPKL